MSNEAFNPSYLVVYPQGISLQWQGDPDAVGYDDVGFTLELLANLSSTLCIDSSRVYAAGKSNGGGFAANVLACDPQASRIFAAFAGASGAYYPGATDANCNGDVVPLTCNPGRYPIPLFTTHGDSDGQLGAHYFVRGLGHTWPSIAAGSLFDATPLLLAFWNKWTLDTTPYNFANASVTTPTISSTTRVSSSATSTSSISAASLCPSANDQTVTDSNGNVYRVACSADNSIGSYSNAQASTSYLDCMTACDAAISAGCAGFTYVGGVNGQGSGTCYLKRSMGIYPAAGSNTISAVRLSGGSSVSNAPAASSSTSSTTSVGPGSLSAAPSASALSCPASNNQVYTHVANGAQFVIECGIDHSVGNMASTSVKNLEGCIAACATTTGCVDVSLSGSACHLKKSLGAVVNSGGILGARFVGFAPVTSTSSTSISTRVSSSSVSISIPGSTVTALTSSSSSSLSTSSSSSLSSSSLGVLPSVGTNGYTTTVYPPTCTAINTNIYAVADDSGKPYLFMCGGGSAGGTAFTIANVANWTACFQACGSYTGCTGFSYNQGANFGNGVGQCLIKTESPQPFVSTANLLSTRVAGYIRPNTTTSTSRFLSTFTTMATSSQATISTSSAASSISSPISSSVTKSATSFSTAIIASSSLASSSVASSSIIGPSITPIPAPSCPAANGTTYTDAGGLQYTILCTYDTFSGIISAVPSVGSFGDCAVICDTTSGCNSLTWNGTVCSLKQSFGQYVIGAIKS
ncbi:hypothetical protein E4T38_09163 [Aureobasidium subglaciale]|nr:hypothetical protein E4T38_09163 [Aureobasidium subglaciale]KAI5214398.1 hypothetical protein E4T40_09049 [Aureobasidium subglaciale]KAI5216943.1 hypothetical protein E4T41_09051 [Aureobasidium subglaciale]KAI5253220.1 hypothetical protein E4T46_09669 [Aureobasidium subglaciale]